MDTSDWLQLAGLLVSLFAVGVAIWYSRRGLRLAAKASADALELAKQELDMQREATLGQLRQNWNIAGSDLAVNWRNQVLDLHDRGCTRHEIRDILMTEWGVDFIREEDATHRHEETGEIVTDEHGTAIVDHEAIGVLLTSEYHGNGTIDGILDVIEEVEKRRTKAS
jgi:hypothetical protein